MVRIEDGVPTRAEIPITAVASRIRAERSSVAIPAVGDTVRLRAAVGFVTGDTIPDRPVRWSSENPDVVAITPVGLALARHVGETRLFVRPGELVDTVHARVISDRRPRGR